MPATLQDVIDRLTGGGLSDTRKRDLRSEVASYGKLVGRAPATIPLDLADIRSTLDGMVPAQAKVSRKRWPTCAATSSPPSMHLGCGRCLRPPT